MKVVTLEYIEEIKTPFARNFFQKIAERTLAECRFSFLQGKKISLNTIVVSESKIKKINREYRGKDAVTDVLSFGEYETRLALEKEKRQEIFLGEIFFSPAFIIKQAKRGLSDKAKEATMKEMAYIFSHGVLHLVGFDHEEEMFAIQEKIADLS
jgi:probable rRNA maturation factor